jgi:HAD superfamily hydrolase (TIGR01509 family)
MSEAGVRAVLWDLDGTLVDSAEQHWQAWREVLEARGYHVTREQFERTFGWRNDAILAEWLGDAVTPHEAAAIGAKKEERYRELVTASGLIPLPGAADWVRRLAENGWRQAIASSAPRANVEVVVGALGLGDYFAAMVAAEDVSEGKPAPDVFLEAAGRTGALPEMCVVVEDAAAGVEGAHRAGMACIGVGGLQADLTVTSLTELPDDAFDRLVGSRRG